MSSTVSGPLSAGAQLLANEKLLLPASSQSDIGGANSEQGLKKTAAAAPLATSSQLFGPSTSPGGDTVELSAEAMHMLQQMGELGGSTSSSSHAIHSYSAPAAYESFDYLG
jgi:hypothetical protein